MTKFSQSVLSLNKKVFLLAAVIVLTSGFFVATQAAQAGTPTIWYVDANNASGVEDGISPATAFTKIQAAVDAANAEDTINVAAGTYNEGDTSRDIYTGATGSSATGLLVYKNGLTIQGVDGSGNPITDRASVVATIKATQRDASLGDTIITGDNVTLSGLRFELADLPVDANKNVFATGENFTLKNSVVDNLKTGYSGLYISDERGGMHVNNFTVQDNQFLKGEITVINGVGQSGPASGRKITGNLIEHITDWAGISLTGITGRSWDTQPIGDVTITGNTFTDNAYQIMARGSDYGNPAGYWAGFLANNTFDKAVLTLNGDDARANAFERLGWINSLTDSSKNAYLRIIGTDIQESITRATDGDTINVGAGTYKEQLTINKALILNGSDGAILDGATLGLQKDAVKIKSGNVTFNNIDVTNFSGNGIIVGYEASVPGSLQNVHITNSKISNIQPGYSWGFGIYVGYESEGFGYTPPKLTTHLDYSGLLIENNEITNTHSSALVLQSITGTPGTIQVKNNNIHDNATNDGIWIETARNLLIENNIINNNKWGIELGSIAEDPAYDQYILNGSYGPKNITIRGNEIKNNSADGIALYDGWPGTILIQNNAIQGSAPDVKNYLAESLAVANNWWGTVNPTEIAAKISGTVSYTPFYINSGKTLLNTALSDSGSSITITAPTVNLDETTDGTVGLPAGASELALGNDSVLDFSANANSAALNGDINIGGATANLSSFTSGELTGKNLDDAQTVGDKSVDIAQAVKLSSGLSGAPIVLTNSTLSNVSVAIPDGTTILAPAGWTGTIAPPKTDTGTVGNAPSGFSVGGTKIEVGSASGILLFDKAVKITLAGVTGTVAYKPSGSDNWTAIGTQCASATDHSNISFPNECYFPDGGNTVIWTYHFTTFGSLDAIPAPKAVVGGSVILPSSGGFSSGSVSASPAASNSNKTVPTITPQVLGEKIFSDEQLNNIITDLAAVWSENRDTILANASTTRDDNAEKNTSDKYISKLNGHKNLSAPEINRLNFFITYGTAGTKILGAGERAGVINSYLSAFGKLPTAEAELQDAIKIANGRWPSARSEAALTKAKATFKNIYGREADMNNANDNAAVTVMAYGLRPSLRNLNSEKAAILAFRYFIKRAPVSAIDWDTVRAIAYSGAKR